MQNIEAIREGDKLHLIIDLGKQYGKSRSGKSSVIATTSGNVRVHDTGERVIKMGVNVYEVEAKEAVQ